MFKLRGLVVLLLVVFGVVPAQANRLVVANTQLHAPVDGKVDVRFDLSWDHSWRDGINYDAVWVFIKYSIDGGTNWHHATMKAAGTNPDGTSVGTGTNLEIIVPSDKKGAFIQRASEGMGLVSNTGVQLQWDFKTDGVSPSRTAHIKVFAIEMVYIPEGPFYLGSGGDESGHFHEGGDPSKPFLVTNGPIRIANEAGCLWGTSSGGNNTIGPDGDLPAEFPTGYQAFYLMKTEISQRQYCDFLNTLTAGQQGNRHDTSLHFNSGRNFIKRTYWDAHTRAVFGCDANGNAGTFTNVTDISKLNQTNDGEWVACNWLSEADVKAYAGWAALRPMTELEYEKACRGPMPPVQNEYAWGSAILATATTSLLDQNTAAERPNQGNCCYASCSPQSPYRCGSFARANSGRVDAGAGFYGCLDLAGNVWERTVTVGAAGGRAFKGEHGIGELDQNGVPLGVASWIYGLCYRGGAWYGAASNARVSDRSYAALVGYADGIGGAASRSNSYGGRAARAVPSGVDP